MLTDLKEDKATLEPILNKWMAREADLELMCSSYEEGEVDANIKSTCELVKEFLQSEFGNEVDRIKSLAPFQRINDVRKTIRRATEEARIPYTFVSANSNAPYFIDYFLHPCQKPSLTKLVIYGDGFTKDGIVALNIMVANDPRTLNKLVIYKPPMNVISQSKVVSLWKKKTGRTLKRVYSPEAEMVNLSESKIKSFDT
ncbi:isoeugenol synthase 1-like [Cryptomeria japonica]|uniref:isoeugenol synthase 1-like n=1 Tax=Cryptomeria japonica TaxID=3369 RepID=UPI0025AD988C|nr:isoeugenol synthase 1-like [Cryptomeria japonica]